MQSVVAQLVTSALLFVFGLVAIAALRAGPATREPMKSAWLLTAWAFGLTGAIAVIHSLWAAHAFLAGPGSTGWDLFVRWAPAANHARGAAMIVFCIELGVLATRVTSCRRVVLLLAVGIPIGALAGAVAAMAEGTASSPTHFLHLATSNLFTLFILAGALLLHLARDTMDRLLWICLTLYWMRLGIGALWLSALAWAGLHNAIRPRPSEEFVLAALVYLGMIAVGILYVRRRRRNMHVPAVLEHLRPLRVRSM